MLDIIGSYRVYSLAKEVTDHDSVSSCLEFGNEILPGWTTLIYRVTVSEGIREPFPHLPVANAFQLVLFTAAGKEGAYGNVLHNRGSPRTYSWEGIMGRQGQN